MTKITLGILDFSKKTNARKTKVPEIAVEQDSGVGDGRSTVRHVDLKSYGDYMRREEKKRELATAAKRHKTSMIASTTNIKAASAGLPTISSSNNHEIGTVALAKPTAETLARTREVFDLALEASIEGKTYAVLKQSLIESSDLKELSAGGFQIIEGRLTIRGNHIPFPHKKRNERVICWDTTIVKTAMPYCRPPGIPMHGMYLSRIAERGCPPLLKLIDLHIAGHRSMDLERKPAPRKVAQSFVNKLSPFARDFVCNPPDDEPPEFALADPNMYRCKQDGMWISLGIDFLILSLLLTNLGFCVTNCAKTEGFRVTW